VADSALRWLVPAALALMIAPEFQWILVRWSTSAADPGWRHLPEWYGRDPVDDVGRVQMHTGLVSAIRRFGAAVPAGECVFAIKPSLVSLLARRSGYAPPAERLNDEEFGRQLEDRGCHHFILLGFASPSFHAPYYPLGRIERLKIVDRATLGGSTQVIALLARLEP
jgi:hypothetical protein